MKNREAMSGPSETKFADCRCERNGLNDLNHLNVLNGLLFLTLIHLLDEPFHHQLLQRGGIVETPRVGAFCLGITLGEVFHRHFHFGKRDRGNIADVAEHVTLERALPSQGEGCRFIELPHRV